jgi:hypothetical protein
MAKKTTELPAGPKSKTDVVRELLAKGITAPKDIAAAAKSEFGVEITPGYASIIKGGLKKRKGGKRAIAKGGRVVHAATKTKPNSASPDLSLENLALRFALKAGSVDAAIAALEKLR